MKKEKITISVNQHLILFNIPGIYDSELQYGSIFFSIENITINSNAYLVVKIDVKNNPRSEEHTSELQSR